MAGTLSDDGGYKVTQAAIVWITDKSVSWAWHQEEVEIPACGRCESCEFRRQIV